LIIITLLFALLVLLTANRVISAWGDPMTLAQALWTLPVILLAASPVWAITLIVQTGVLKKRRGAHGSAQGSTGAGAAHAGERPPS